MFVSRLFLIFGLFILYFPLLASADDYGATYYRTTDNNFGAICPAGGAYSSTESAACGSCSVDALGDGNQVPLQFNGTNGCEYLSGSGYTVTPEGVNSLSCSVGFVFDGVDSCVQEEECEIENRDPIDGSCAPAPPPDCGVGEITVTTTIGLNIHSFCAVDLSSDDKECQNVSGYFNGVEICTDDSDSCTATGGSYGYFNGEPICVPPFNDVGNEIPDPDTCGSDEVTTLSSGGGWGCGSPIHDIQDKDIPIAPIDTDGDGIPDSNDSDIDGDGLDNSVDPDIDGDGIPNADDLTPEGDDSSVGGGGSCSSQPSCSGDAIQCAILFQTWKTRCALEQENDEATAGSSSDCNTAPICDGDAIQCAILEQIWQNGCAFGDFDGDLGGEATGLGAGQLFTDNDLTSVLSGVYSQGTTASSCPVGETLNVGGTTITVEYTAFCDLASAVRPLVLVIFSLIAFRVVMRAF